MLAMPGPRDDDLARSVARERVRPRCQVLIDGELPSHVFRLRRLHLMGLGATPSDTSSDTSSNTLRLNSATSSDSIL